jgi:hypothetical protein
LTGDKENKAKQDHIERSLKEFDDDMKKLQRSLYEFLSVEYLAAFETVDGRIALSKRNALRLAEFDAKVDQFKKKYGTKPFARLADNMIKMTGLTSDYFKSVVGAEKTVANIEDKIKNYRALVGVDESGKVIKGSFIDKLADNADMRTKLSGYMRNAVESQMKYKDFAKGFRDIITGKDGVNGAYEKYVGNYVHDMFFNQAQQQENFFAQQLGMKYFVYRGSEIETTRPFCRDRHGKVFSVKHAKTWNELDWSGKIPDVDIMQQRGGYGCRHQFVYISDDAAKRMGIYELDTESGTPVKVEYVPSKPKTNAAEPVKQQKSNDVFVPAKTTAEAEQRIMNAGVKNVTLKGLKGNELNAVLEAVETEFKFSEFNINTIQTFRRSNSPVGALYSPSNNSISINLSNIKKWKYKEVKGYEEQLKEIELIKKDIKEKYLGKPEYKQSVVRARLNACDNRTFGIQQKIKNGEVARKWTVSQGVDDQYKGLMSIITHEMGHYRHFQQLDKEFFHFSKARSISEYGRTNEKEYFAEWYAQYRMHGSDGVPDDLLKIFKKLE